MSVSKLGMILFSSFLTVATAPLAFSQGTGNKGTEPVATSVTDVKQIQQALSDLGYAPGDINGMISAQTQDSIRQFQWLNGLPVTGIVDEQTKMTLDSQWRGGVRNAQLGQTPLSAGIDPGRGRPWCRDDAWHAGAQSRVAWISRRRAL